MGSAEVFNQWFSQPSGTFGDLKCGKAVDVDIGYSVPNRPGDVEVVITIEVGMDAPLEADLGGAHSGRLGCPVGDLVHLQEVGRASEIQRQRSLGETAKATLVGADVGVVDISVRHPRHVVADPAPAQLVGYLGHRNDLGAPRFEQRQELLVTGPLTG